MHEASADHRPEEDSIRRFASLSTRYGNRLRSYLAAYLGRTDYHLAEILAQETWVRVFRSLHELRVHEGDAFGWLAAIARQTVVAHRTATRRHPRATAALHDAARNQVACPIQGPACDGSTNTQGPGHVMVTGSPASLGVAA